jgi:hypothetical protein
MVWTGSFWLRIGTSSSEICALFIRNEILAVRKIKNATCSISCLGGDHAEKRKGSYGGVKWKKLQLLKRGRLPCGLSTCTGLAG